MKVRDRVKETWTGTGTGTVTLSGSAVTGFRTVAAAMGEDGYVTYCIFQTDNSEWEIGEGMYDYSEGTLARQIIHSSSNSGSIVTFSAGTKYIVLTVPANYWIDDILDLYVDPDAGDDSTGDGSVSAPFATFNRVSLYLQNKQIPPCGYVVVHLLAGSHAGIQLDHPNGGYLEIVGEYSACEITSVQSTSGSAGAYSVIVNLTSIPAGTAVNQYLFIPSPAGGTRPNALAGCWKITNVDEGNKRLTVTVTHQYASGTYLPSGNVADADALVLHTVLGGFTIYNGTFINSLEYLAIEGGIVVGSASEFGGTLWGGYLGIVGSSSNGLSLCGGTAVLSHVCCCGNTAAGVQLSSCAAAYLSNLVCAGNTTWGIAIAGNASLDASACLSIGNGAGGLSSGYGAMLSCSSCYSQYNIGPGLSVGSRGICVCWFITSTYNSTYGIYAGSGGYVEAYSGTVSNNTTANYSPNVNTQGNEYGYINT